MTSYSSCSHELGEHSIHIEIRTQNHRYRDISLSVPKSFLPLDQDIRLLIQNAIARGSIELSLQINTKKTRLQINEELIEELKNIQHSIEETPINLSIADLTTLKAIYLVDEYPDIKLYETEFLSVLQKLLVECKQIRALEGQLIAQEIQKHLDIITDGVENIRQQIPLIEENIRKTVSNYFTQYVTVPIDQSRMYQEITALLLKSSITEELLLLDGHILSMKDTIQESEHKPVGKRLDFLGQEMNRELHTIASKISRAGIQTCIVSMREAVENIRELIRNVE